MRAFGIWIKPSAVSEVRIPGSRLARVNQFRRRRLDDDVEDLFNRACVSNDLASAADLLALLEKWHARRSAGYGSERRISGAALFRARRELDRLSRLLTTGAASG
jgi:hypothetical protein